MFGRSKKVKGVATVVGYQVIRIGASQSGGPVHSLLDVHAVVTAPGIEPTPVQFTQDVSQAVMPLADGYLFEVELDPAKPGEVKVTSQRTREIEQIRERRIAAAQAGDQAAAELAAKLRADGTPPGE